MVAEGFRAHYAAPADYAATAAKPDQAVTAQHVYVDPKCEFALYRRPPTASSAAKSAQGGTKRPLAAFSLVTT